jgi:hypothetical protein
MYNHIHIFVQDFCFIIHSADMAHTACFFGTTFAGEHVLMQVKPDML